MFRVHSINDVSLADAGDYKCEADNEVGKVSTVTSIRVIEAPVIQLQPSDDVLSVTEGDEVKVICTATGTPSPSVRWIKEDTVAYDFVPASDAYNRNQAVLEFYRVNVQDAKAYKCIATNEAGTDERYVVLDVKYRRGDAPDDSDVVRDPTYYQPSRPQPPYYQQTHPENVYETKTGDNVTLHCDLSKS